MILHEIKKQQLLFEPLSADALKLARAIYYTYIENEKDTFMEIKIDVISNLLNLQRGQKAQAYIIYLLEELNEPLCVRDFKYYANRYRMRFIYFCTYKIEDEMIAIELSDEFLHAEAEYMIDPFLKG